MISGKRRTIGVFNCKAYSVFDTAVFSTLEKEAKRLDYDVVVFSTVGYFASQNEYDAQERGMFAFAPLEHLDGIIVAPDTYEIEGFKDALMTEIRERATCPVIAIRHYGDDVDCVYTDEAAAIRPLIRHLIEDHKLKRIAFLAGYKGHPDSELRLAVYRQEMADHGLTVDEEKDIRYGNMWLDCGEDAYRFFFSDPDRKPEAVICANDYMAAGLMRVLYREGLKVPDDVILTGFDNVKNLTLEQPTLTTVEQDFCGMTSLAFEELDRMIRSGEKRKPGGKNRKIGIPGKLILGEACGCGNRGRNYYARLCLEQGGEIRNRDNRTVGMTYLNIELSACDSLTELHDVLIRKLSDTPELRDFYLCMFEAPQGTDTTKDYAEEVTDTARLVHAVRDRQDCGMPMISFDRYRLLPPMAERSDEPQVFYLTLLHQKESNYGYSMFHFQDGKYPSNFYQMWNIILSGALRNMHNRNELQNLYEERRLSSITDVMTRLLNRRGMEEQIAPMWQHLSAHRETVSFVNFDVDFLKKINDNWGHQAGDYAIRTVAEAIRRAAPKDAVTARVGGDEFIAFLPYANEQTAAQYIERFQETLAEINRVEDRAFSVGASCGSITVKLDDGVTVEQCIRQSDMAMYKEKALHHTRREE